MGRLGHSRVEKEEQQFNSKSLGLKGMWVWMQWMCIFRRMSLIVRSSSRHVMIKRDFSSHLLEKKFVSKQMQCRDWQNNPLGILRHASWLLCKTDWEMNSWMFFVTFTTNNNFFLQKKLLLIKRHFPSETPLMAISCHISTSQTH